MINLIQTYEKLIICISLVFIPLQLFHKAWIIAIITIHVIKKGCIKFFYFQKKLVYFYLKERSKKKIQESFQVISYFLLQS